MNKGLTLKRASICWVTLNEELVVRKHNQQWMILYFSPQVEKLLEPFSELQKHLFNSSFGTRKELVDYVGLTFKDVGIKMSIENRFSIWQKYHFAYLVEGTKFTLGGKTGAWRVDLNPFSSVPYPKELMFVLKKARSFKTREQALEFAEQMHKQYYTL